MIDRLTEFVDRLRLLGVAVSTSEVIDASRVLGLIDWDDRETFRSALSAALIKNSAHRFLFDVLFDVYFSHSPHDLQLPDEATGDLPEAIVESLLLNDDRALDDLAFESIQRFAGIEPGRPVGGRYYQWKVEQALGMSEITDRLASRLASDAQAGSILDGRLSQDEARDRVAGFRARIERIIRSRLVAERGPEAMARALARPLPEDVEFLQATADELVEMKRSVASLARRLAARLSYKHHRTRRGRLDFRRTIRASLQTGGTPAYPKFKQRTVRPDIVVLCDVSGSV
ncbi:MAG: VWA domain-containing protein, partial [Actinomycetota bacterium]